MKVTKFMKKRYRGMATKVRKRNDEIIDRPDEHCQNGNIASLIYVMLEQVRPHFFRIQHKLICPLKVTGSLSRKHKKPSRA